MKRILGIIFVFVICTAFSLMASAGELPFKDVSEDAWYYNSVKSAYELQLIKGKDSADTFKPDDDMTYAEAIKLAACMNQLYTNGTVTIADGMPWYQPYVDYCTENKIIDKEYPLNDKVTRAGYIAIFASALPAEAFEQINEISNGFITDVSMEVSYVGAVYKFYKAGIIGGVDEKHSFAPNETIKRSEVATVITRMMDKSKRVNVGFKAVEYDAEQTKTYDVNSGRLLGNYTKYDSHVDFGGDMIASIRFIIDVEVAGKYRIFTLAQAKDFVNVTFELSTGDVNEITKSDGSVQVSVSNETKLVSDTISVNTGTYVPFDTTAGTYTTAKMFSYIACADYEFDKPGKYIVRVKKGITPFTISIKGITVNKISE